MATVATSVERAVPRHREPFAFAYGCLVLFLVVYCARPEDWIPGLAVVPLAKITGFVTLLAFLLSFGLSGRNVLNLPREMFYMVLLFGQLLLAAIFSPVWRGGAFQIVVFDFSKALLVSLVIVLAVTNLSRLRRILFVYAGSVALIVLIVTSKFNPGGAAARRLYGISSGIYGNPNDLALSIALALPVCLAFMLRARGGFRKAAWALAALLMAYAVLLTYSRGGLLALLVAVGVSAWEFAVNGRRRLQVLLLGFVGLVVLSIGIPSQYGQRVETIFNPDEDPTGSAQSRERLLRVSIETTTEHPLFGVGPGNFRVVSGQWQDTHNAYTQISSEGGLPALFLFLLILGRTFANIRRAKRLAKDQPELLLLAGALHASLAAFLVGCFFANVAYLFFPYFLVSYVTALGYIASRTNASAAGSNPAARAVEVHSSVYERA